MVAVTDAQSPDAIHRLIGLPDLKSVASDGSDADTQLDWDHLESHFHGSSARQPPRDRLDWMKNVENFKTGLTDVTVIYDLYVSVIFVNGY